MICIYFHDGFQVQNLPLLGLICRFRSSSCYCKLRRCSEKFSYLGSDCLLNTYASRNKYFMHAYICHTYIILFIDGHFNPATCSTCVIHIFVPFLLKCWGSILPQRLGEEDRCALVQMASSTLASQGRRCAVVAFHRAETTTEVMKLKMPSKLWIGPVHQPLGRLDWRIFRYVLKGCQEFVFDDGWLTVWVYFL